MSSTRTVGRIIVAIGTGISAVAISVAAHDIASAIPQCRDDVDCRPLPTPTSRRPTTTTPTTTVGPPPPPPTTWGPPPTTPSFPPPADPGSEPTPTCPRYATDCAPL
jgi:hypothetical protein